MPTTDFWNGTGSWTTNGDWTDNSPPVPSEGAEIETGTDSLTSAATIAALQVDAPATLQIATGGSLADTGTAAVAGYLYLLGGGAATVTGDLSITGGGRVDLDPYFFGGGGGSSLTIGGTLTNSSTDAQAIDIGTSNIGAGDTVTAGALNNTGDISITGNGTIQSLLNITTGAAGFGTLGVETGSIYLTSNALLEFATGQIGTIDGIVQLDGPDALIADAGTLTSNSALNGLNTVAGYLYLQNGNSIGVSGNLSITGGGRVDLDPYFFGGGGGSSLTIGGTLTNSSSDAQAIDIGTGNIGAGDTVTAGALNNTGDISITGNGTIQSLLNITTGAAGFGTLGVETGSVYLASNALLEFATGQIGTIDGIVQLDGPDALIADAGTLTSNSALNGLNTVAGYLYLQNGNSIGVSGNLSITGGGRVDLDPYFFGGGGGSSLTIGGTLTNNSSDAQAIDIGTGNIGAGDTVTAAALNNTGDISITGNGTVQSTLDITTGAAGFGTVAVETGFVGLYSDALLEFASGQIGTIDGEVELDTSSARIADAATLATNSALTGLNTVAGYLYLENGNSVGVTGNLAITGGGAVDLDSYFLSGGGGSSLTIAGTLTNSSSNGNALDIGYANISTGDTVTAKALNNTGAIAITGNGTVQSTLDITTGAAGFGTVAVETGSVGLYGDALLEFASGQIGTIDGAVELDTSNARIADAATLATNSALTGLNTVAGELYLENGNSVHVTGNLAITGGGAVDLDSYFLSGGGGSSLTIAGTLTNSSSNGNALDIGYANISTGDTVTAKALSNSGAISITGNGAIQSTLDITTGAAGFGTVAVETGSVGLYSDALLEFGSGQIGTIDGEVELDTSSARIADAAALSTNSALTGLNTVAGELYLENGNSVSVTGNLSITGSGAVDLDSYFLSGSGGSSLTIGGTLTNSSSNSNALDIGYSNIATGDTVTAKALNNTSDISITGNGTIQSTLDITTGAAGFGTLAVETGSIGLYSDALLEFASGQIGTIDGVVTLDDPNARIADAGTLATNSALTGLNTVAGDLFLENGNSVNVTGNLSITGFGAVDLDSYFLSGSGGSSLTVGGTLTNSSSNANALDIGYSNIATGDTVTAGALSNSGAINITGNGTIVSALDVNGPATNNATVNIDASGEVVMGAGDAYTQAAGATNIATGGTLAGTVDVTGGSLDGTGTVAGVVNDTSGTVFGGPNIGNLGTLTVNGTYNQSGTGDLEANIGSGGTSSGVVTDSGGFVNLSGGTLSVSATPAVGTLLTVMTFNPGHLAGQFAAVQDGSSIGDGSFVNLGDGTSLEVFYNEDSGNIQIERVENSSLATSYTWIDGTANWSVAADWSGGVVPNSTANVVIGNTSNGNVTLNGSSGDTTVNSLTIAASNALTVSSVSLTSANGISVAASGSLSLSSGEINGSVLSGAGLLQSSNGTNALAADTISSGTSFIGQDNTTTELLGTIDNAGSIEQIGGNGQNGILDVVSPVTLTGGGTVTLDTIATNGANAYLEGSGQTLTSNNTIQGTGIIGNGSLALINNGLIDATPEGGTSTLTFNSSGEVTNTTTMEATGGATLFIGNPLVDNAGGNITVVGSASTVDLSNTTVQGGTLNNSGGGTLDLINSTLDGSTQGALTISTGSTVTSVDNATSALLGSIVNKGLIQLNGGNGQNGALLINSSTVTLSGSGTVTLDTVANNGGSAYIEGNGNTLTNTNNTIQGTGIIGNGSLALINQHVIDATPEGGTSTLTLNGSGGVTNTATLEATAGGSLVIYNTVNNTGGNITVSGSTSGAQLNGATVEGGTLNNSTGGSLDTVGSAILDGSTHGALTISSGSTYTASDNATTYLLGSIVNQGLLLLNGGNAQNGFLVINSSSVTLSGTGALTLETFANNGGAAYIQGNGNTLTNSTNTIQGTGVIGNGSLALINNHVIDAMVEGGTLGTATLTLNGSGGVTNTDLLEASAGATLAIETNVTNTGANITANGSLAVVAVSNSATITGGTLNTVNGGVFESTGNATLQGVTISANSTYTASDNLTTTLLGTIDNVGEIELIGGNGQAGYLQIGNPVTLTGGGTVLLDTISTDNDDAYIYGNGQTLTNSNNTILGTGIIGNGSLMLINAGVIDATPEGGTDGLTLNGGGVTNTSTMEASSGGVLVINTTVNNAGGNITTADSTSTVEVYAGTVQGGTLNNTAGGIFETAGNSELDGLTNGALTISAGSVITATDNTSTYLLGTINNDGTIVQVGGNGQAGYLNLAGAVTLTGGGTVTLDSITTNGGDAYIFGNGETLTNTNNTIQGTGIIGDGSLVLINDGLIDATPESGTSNLTLNGGGVTNTSTMEASAGGVLVINTTVDNAGGNITTADAASTVEVYAGTVQGGTLNNTAGGTFETAAGSVLDGLTHGTLTISSGSVITATDNTSTYLVGTINNAGTIVQVGGNGQNGYLNLAGSVTLTGGGTVTLDTIANNGGDAYIYGNGQTLTNTNNTIQGTGIIGNGSLALINKGVIDATPEGGTSTLTVNNSGGFTSTGTLEATGGATLALDVGPVTASGLVSVTAGSALDLNGELTFSGTIANFGAINGGGTTEVAFGSGTDRLIMGPSATFGGTVVGDGTGSTIELAAGSGAGTLTGLGTSFANFGTVIVDAGGTWTVDVTAAQLASTTFVGDGAGSTLALTTPGTFSLATVSNFGTIDLAAGNNTVTVPDKTLSGGAVTIVDGASGNNSVSAASDTSASRGKSLTYVAGSGTDTFTGGFENDTVDVSAAAVGGDTLTGGSGTNTLVLTSAGVLSLGGVSKFPTIDLAAGNSTVTVTDALLSGAPVTINDGASGNNSISAAGDTSASKGKVLTYNAGSGTDSFTGGFENDRVNVSAAAVGGDTLTGGSGANTLTLTNAGSANLGGVSDFATIDLAAGNSTVTVTDTTLAGGTVTINDGASGNNSVSAAGDTTASKGKTLAYYTGSGTDSFTGGFENDSVHVSAASVGGDTLTGGSGNNVLVLTSAGSVNLGGVSKFAGINLAAGNNTVTVTDTTLSGGMVTVRAGASGNNSISAAGDTAASKGKALIYYTGSGTDSFTGGFENDTVYVTTTALVGDTLTGGSGTNTLALSNAGSVSLGGVKKFGTIRLAAGNNTVTVTDTTLSGGAVTVDDGASGNNSVSAAGDTAASKGKTLTYYAGPGTDSFTGGFEIDMVYVATSVASGDTLTGGSGNNILALTGAGSVNLGGISKFATIDLGAGSSTVTVTDTTLSVGSVTINDGTSGNNSVSAAGDTTASKGKTLAYVTGSGTDSFAGGFENDSLRVTATAVGGDTLTGGSGNNTLVLTSAGSVNLGGVSKFAGINLLAGNNTVTVTDTTLSGGAVTLRAGTSGNNSISAAGDTAASKGKSLFYYAGPGTDSFTGGFENDAVYVTAAALGGDTLTGGSGSNTLTLTSAGSINLGAVTRFATIDLGAGTSTVTVTDTTLAGGAVTLNDGKSGNNSVSAAGDTSASKGKTLTYFVGTGVETFTGGFENDSIHVAATAIAGDKLTGGSGNNTLVLTSAGSVSLGGASKFAAIILAAGNNTVTVADTTLSGGTVTLRDGASGNNSVSATGDTTASKGKSLFYYAGPGTDSFTGGFENDAVYVAASAVGGDTLTGGSGTNTLTLTSAGSVNLGGVSKFATINLAAGNSTVTLTDTTLSGGAVTVHDGASGNNSVSAAGDTAASAGKTLTYVTGPGTDSFTGGFENDTVNVSAAAVGGDTLTGGSGTNTLTLTSAGSVNLGGVSKFGTIDLAAGSSTVTVTDTTLSGGAVTIKDGASGNNSISAAGDTSASSGTSLTYDAGSGTDSFTGGFENDTIYAGTGLGTYTAGSGSDTFVFIKSSLPTQTLDNFLAGTDDILVYGTHSAGGFDLGSTDNGLNPTSPTAIDQSIFIASASGAFTLSTQRFAYDTTNGQLHYSATGSNSSESLVATLTGAPTINASSLLFEH